MRNRTYNLGCLSYWVYWDFGNILYLFPFPVLIHGLKKIRLHVVLECIFNNF